MHKSSYWSILALACMLMLAPAVEARTCNGVSDLYGAYGWIASRSVSGDPAAPAVTGSFTPLGSLLAGAGNTAAFASVGRLFFDGNGGLNANATTTSSIIPVGTYTVNTDCTIALSLKDTFSTPAEAGLTPVQIAATFEGVSVQNGNEIDLIQTGTSSGAALTLIKTRRQFGGCSTDGVEGPFGLTARGASTQAAIGNIPAVTTSFNLASRVVANGAGKFVSDLPGLASPLTARQATGTYIIDPDCTGTGTLVDKDGKTRKIAFVVVAGSAGVNAPPILSFVFTDPGVVGTGTAQQ